MIKSFRDRDTERLFRREPVRRFPADLRRAMLRKLIILNAAESLDDLRSLRVTGWKNYAVIARVSTVSDQ